MIKANQLQLRTKEKELVRFKQKATRYEGMELASRQKNNLLNGGIKFD